MSGYLTMGEMKSSLGIRSLGHRVKLIQAIDALKTTSEGTDERIPYRLSANSVR